MIYAQDLNRLWVIIKDKKNQVETNKTEGKTEKKRGKDSEQNSSFGLNSVGPFYYSLYGFGSSLITRYLTN